MTPQDAACRTAEGQCRNDSAGDSCTDPLYGMPLAIGYVPWQQWLRKRRQIMSKDQMRLLKYISQVSFALTETNLYLDTHPCDKVALSYYQMVKKQREEAVQEYSEKYGPLQADQVNCKDYWTWVETPWPWEL